MLEKLVGKKKIYWFLLPRDFNDIKKQLLRMSKILDQNIKAKEIIAKIDKRLYAINEKTKYLPMRPSVLVEIFYPPYMTAGKNTFISDIVKKAGGTNALDLKEDWPSISMEDLITSDPDIILKTHSSTVDKNLRLIPAYKDGRIYTPKNVDHFLQPGIESIDAVEELHEYLINETKQQKM